jgi:hypothetical protein
MLSRPQQLTDGILLHSGVRKSPSIGAKTSIASFEVRVVNDDQKGIRGVRVRLEFTSLTRGLSAAETTDSDGSAYFDGYEEGSIRVYIDGSNCGEYYYRDGDSITITK